MVYIEFKTFQRSSIIVTLIAFLCAGAIITYISSAGIMDTSSEMQF